jgi:hypothetical protein
MSSVVRVSASSVSVMPVPACSYSTSRIASSTSWRPPYPTARVTTGATFGAGQEEPSGTDGKRCVYGSETTNVFSVIVGQADTSADAEADYSQEEADAQSAITKQAPSGVKLNEQTQDVSGLAYPATVVNGSVNMGGMSSPPTRSTC